MNILISPNAFKHGVTADRAATAIREGLMASKLRGHYECCPVGDGGDGTGQLIIQKCKGSITETVVYDPLKRMVKASFGVIEDGATAVIEMAAASGLSLLASDELNPLRATSYGTGELIKHALDCQVDKIIVTMGGSAVVDGGMGLLRALGIRFLDGKKEELHFPEELVSLCSIDISGIDRRVQSREIVVLCDVDNELLGNYGAAHVFGPQKGASPQQVQVLEHAMNRLSTVVLKEIGRDISSIKYGGAAGGAAAGIAGVLGAALVCGIDYFLDLVDFDTSLRKSDLLITGEGSIDEQTLNGKAPFGVASRGKKLGLPVIGMAGRVPLNHSDRLRAYFDVLLPIGNEPMGLDNAIRHTEANLVRTGRELGNLLTYNIHFTNDCR